MGQVPGKVRRKGAIRNDSKVQGLRNKKGGAATEEMGSREQVRKRLGVQETVKRLALALICGV